MSEAQISLGDRVYTKKTGQLATATVIGIVHSERYNRMVLKTNDYIWGKMYPNWQEKPVVTLEFDKPQRHLTFEEYCKGNEDQENFVGLSQEDKEFYYQRIPVVYFVVAPIEDVEVI